jgi:hypothetical protein
MVGGAINVSENSVLSSEATENDEARMTNDELMTKPE